MELTLSTREGFTVAATKGPIDESARDSFRELLHPLVGQKGTRLIVDLSGSSRIPGHGDGLRLLRMLCGGGMGGPGQLIAKLHGR